MSDTELTGGDGAPGSVASSAGAVTLEQARDAVVLTVTGALDLALAPKLQHLIDRAAQQRPRLMVIDLTALDFLASAGMAVLVRAHRQCPEPTRLRIVAAGRIALRPLELTRLTDELAIHPTLPAALDDT